jgi:hypothetical protein
MKLAQLLEERFEPNAAVHRRVRSQSADRLLELARGGDRTLAAGLVPGDRHVHEPLVEVAFLRRSGAPHVLEHLVGGEVFAGPNQAEPVLKL